MVKKLYHLVLRVIVLVTLVVPLDLVVRVTLVVVFPLFVTFTVLRVIFAIVLKLKWFNTCDMWDTQAPHTYCLLLQLVLILYP